MHPTACACKRNWSAWGQLYTKLRSKMAVERARKLIYVHSNGKEWQGEGGHGLVPQPARGRGIGSSSSSSSSSIVTGAVIGSVQLCGGGGATEIFVY